MKTASEIANNIQPVLSGCSEIVAAFLFGSAVSGKLGPESDIDIALLLNEPISNLDRKALLKNIFPALCRALRADVHILILNDASYLARAQVFNKGYLLYDKDKKQLALFSMKSISLFAEFAPYMEMTRNGLQNKMRETHG